MMQSMQQESVTVFIPIKDHSQRVPGKNFREFAGKPLYRWVIDTCLSVDVIQEIVIDTDSVRLKDELVVPRVRYLDRLPELVGDDTSVNLIIGSDHKHIHSEHILQTHVTNPLLSAETLTQAITTYFDVIKRGYDSLFSVTEHRKRFYYRGQPVNHNPEELIKTQDLEPVVEENSNMYLFSKSSFAAAGDRRIGQKPYLFPQDPAEAIDIDTMADFQLAEQMVSSYEKTT